MSYRVWALSIVEAYKGTGQFATPDIIKVLKTDPDASVKAQAYKTLKAITKQSFPQNQPQKWEAWFKTQQQ